MRREAKNLIDALTGYPPGLFLVISLGALVHLVLELGEDQVLDMKRRRLVRLLFNGLHASQSVLPNNLDECESNE